MRSGPSLNRQPHFSNDIRCPRRSASPFYGQPQLRRVSHRANNIAEVAFLPPDRGGFKLVSHRLTTTLIV
jgi:hypothetical protein